MTAAAPHVIEVGILQISVGNAVVIGLMIAVFVLAVLLPFPGSGRKVRRG
jgi:hypothetical protein